MLFTRVLFRLYQHKALSVQLPAGLPSQCIYILSHFTEKLTQYAKDRRAEVDRSRPAHSPAIVIYSRARAHCGRPRPDSPFAYWDKGTETPVEKQGLREKGTLNIKGDNQHTFTTSTALIVGR